MRMILGLSLVVLGGCSTTSTADLRKLPVSGTYQTSKPPAAAAQCIAESLSDLGTPSVYKTEGGQAVSFSGGGNTLALFDISEAGAVTVRRVSSILPYKEKLAACL